MKTDAQLQQDVIAELKWEQSVEANGIGVEVKDGIVTLAGHVASHAEKWDAERAAQRVSGVKALAIEIDVRLPDTINRSDADVARSVENVLEWTTHVPEDSIKVMVEDGWLTLTGLVDWEYQRRSATDAVRKLMGVRGLSDEIAVRPNTYPNPVKADIEAALKRRAHPKGQDIAVAVEGVNVTLTGIVHTWDERASARQSAWNTPGVRTVKDNIIIAG